MLWRLIQRTIFPRYPQFCASMRTPQEKYRSNAKETTSALSPFPDGLAEKIRERFLHTATLLINNNVLLLNKQISAEAQHVLYKENVFSAMVPMWDDKHEDFHQIQRLNLGADCRKSMLPLQNVVDFLLGHPRLNTFEIEFRFSRPKIKGDEERLPFIAKVAAYRLRI